VDYYELLEQQKTKVTSKNEIASCGLIASYLIEQVRVAVRTLIE
jgi:hypothetical protein